MGALLGEEVVEAGPGDLVFKPRDQWHTFWNAGDEPCRILEIISPAGFERFFAELVELGGALKAEPEALAALNERYGLEMEPGERAGAARALRPADRRARCRSRVRGAPARAGAYAPLPARGPALGEGAHALAHVLRGERGPAQLDQLLLDVLRQLALGGEQRGDHALVAGLRERGVAGQLAGQLERGVELVRGRDAVDEPSRRRSRAS